MTPPLLGPLTLSGFAHPWYWLFLLFVCALVGWYIVIAQGRRKRVLRFANLELLESVAPRRANRWRQLPAILLVCALVLFTTAMAGPTHDVRIPRNRAVVMLVIDVSQSMRATDVAPTRMAATTPAPAAPAPSAGGGYVVQVSSQKSEADAQASFRSLQGKFPAVLGSRSPLIKRADLGEKGVYYRAMVGPFGSPDEASQFCGNLKTAGGQCVVQRN